MAEFSGSLIEDITIATQVAYAEKPGRDYLYDNPELPQEDFFKIAYEIGAASMHSESQLNQPKTDEDGFPAYNFYEPYKYKTIPAQEAPLPLDYEDTLLVTEWAKLPGMKFIEGRPVVSKEDMNNFSSQQIAEGKVTYRKGWGIQAWDMITRASRSTEYIEYLPEHPRYKLQQVCDQLTVFSKDVAAAAGLEQAQHIDLLSLYKVVPQLPQLLRELPKKKISIDEGSWTLVGITENKVAFLMSFLRNTIDPQTS